LTPSVFIHVVKR